MCVRKTKPEILKVLYEKYGEEYEFPNLQYQNKYTKTLVFCTKHCTYEWKSIHKLLNRSQVCKKCGYEAVSNSRRSETHKVNSKLKEVFGELVTCEKYTGSGRKDNIFKCHLFNNTYQYKYDQLLKDGLCRCDDCENYRKESDRWQTFFRNVFKCESVHRGEYIYELEGFHPGDVLEVECKLHGKFYPTAYAHHTLGTRCPKCANANRLYVGGFGDKIEYFKNLPVSDKKDGYVYLVEIVTDTGDRYMKVGITSKTVSHRMKAIRYKPFISEVVIHREHKTNLLRCSEIESEILGMYSRMECLIPRQDMQGWTETFSIQDKESSIGLFDKITNEGVTK